MPAIPLHQLYDRSETGVEMAFFDAGELALRKEALGAHRDDHYIFFFVREGTAELMIDFQSVKFTPGTLYFILPGQVHHGISAAWAGGWFLAVDTGLLTTDQRQVFEQRLLLQQPVVPDEAAIDRLHGVLTSLHDHYRTDSSSPFYRQVLYALLQAFTGLVAAEYRSVEQTNERTSRKAELARAFKDALSISYRDIKSPSAFAEKLNVSPAYLNEALKEMTGLSVSYWIAHEVMLEAKRLLHYTTLSVKEIAMDLGYEDQNYFFRLFRKHHGVTPLAFRAQYHE